MELTGRLLGHYRVGEEISRGGMGVVYRATDTRLNRDVALKVLPHEVVNDDDVRRRFLKEAQAASALEHPHIAVIHGADEVDGIAYIAMELIRGDKLSDVLTRQRIGAARSLELAAEIAAGLARAHEKGIVHRDLKPANVMVTDEGHAKIIDFGIAKLIEVSATAGVQTQTGRDTGVGVVLGTMTYMSPEQARGEIVDHRSDIFSFGILLHEMLAGQPPFRGKTGIETASAILHESAPRLPSLGPAVIAEAGADIQRIVDKCLAKDPNDRYQGMKDAVVDIRTARRRLDTGPQSAAVVPVPSRVPNWAWLAGAAVVIAIAGVLLWTQTRRPVASAATGSGKPSVAVLYFDNTTGDKELDWMRTGITEMVVTDLSQSQNIEVVGTDRLHGILTELNRQDDRVLSPDVISAVAERTGVDRVLVGSYVRAGDAIRINVRLQDAKSGRIESSERVEGPNVAALFGMVDDLSKRIRTKFDALRSDAALLTSPAAATADAGDRGVGDVTTTSIDAYRLYAEGINLHNAFREAEASALFERAVTADPAFAMAYAKLAVAQLNLGQIARGNQAMTQAFKLADRLTPRERTYIEGYYYSLRPATAEKAIAAYTQCLQLDERHEPCRSNLGLVYVNLERWTDAVAQLEPMIRLNGAIGQPFGNGARAYRALGEVDRAYAIANGYASRFSQRAVGRGYVAEALVGLGRNDEGVQEYAKAQLLDATNQTFEISLGVTHLLREDWAAATTTAERLTRSADDVRRVQGALIHSFVAAYQGRGAASLDWADRAAKVYEASGVGTAAIGYEAMALTLMATRKAPQAVAAAAVAVRDATGQPGEPRALVAQTWALSGAGRSADAATAVAALRKLVNPVSRIRDERSVNIALGLSYLAGGDPASAVKALQAAVAALSPRGPIPTARSWHILAWSSLGQALYEAGKPDEARQWFEKVAGSGYERARQPFEFVRSFYYLGKIYENQGDAAKARESYQRFVKYWKDGDLDRDRIAEAQKKIGG
jgi:serine/threonine protein kinase/tetratricopeptide (TPR) repeat protein